MQTRRLWEKEAELQSSIEKQAELKLEIAEYKTQKAQAAARLAVERRASKAVTDQPEQVVTG